MPSAQSIRAPNAPEAYSAVIRNFRDAYKAKYGHATDKLTDQEVLLAWEVGWGAPSTEEEDLWTLEDMHEKLRGAEGG